MKTILAIIFILPFFIFSQEKANSSEKKTNNIPEINAMFPGGNDEMRKFTKENLIYPELAELLGNQGKVYVDFIVPRKAKSKMLKLSEAFQPNWMKKLLGLLKACRIGLLQY